uniref:Uncharacterized protein n=1 Tax=Rhizophora mucronata TaxID=61149 RepID=A0A2P2N524_RHIMU
MQQNPSSTAYVVKFKEAHAYIFTQPPLWFPNIFAECFVSQSCQINIYTD